jgi:hypothetical protein
VVTDPFPALAEYSPALVLEVLTTDSLLTTNLASSLNSIQRWESDVKEDTDPAPGVPLSELLPSRLPLPEDLLRPASPLVSSG